MLRFRLNSLKRPLNRLVQSEMTRRMIFGRRPLSCRDGGAYPLKEITVPATIKVIHATDFMKVTAQGEIDLEESMRLLVEVVLATDHADYALVLDTRNAHSSMSVTDLWHLAAGIDKAGKNLPRKTAVLCQRERFDHAGFFALCAHNRGFNVCAFTCYEDAMEWLIREEPDPETVAAQPWHP